MATTAAYNVPAMSEERKQFRRKAVFLLAAVIALAIGWVFPWKQVIRDHRYREIRQAIRDGRLTEDEVEESLGDEYMEFRKFLDASPS